MAKKKTAKKKTTKKTVKSTPSKKSAGGSSSKKITKKVSKSVVKKTTKKAATKTTKKITKKVTKKPAKKVTKKPTSKKTVSKKVVKKTRKKPVAKKTTKKSSISAKTTKKSASSKVTKADTKKSGSTKAAVPTSASKTDPKSANGGKPPMRRRRPSKVKKPLILPDRPLLLGPNGPSLKPLIPSGPKVKKKKSVLDNVTSKRTKTPLTKTQLESYRLILLVKRAELLGDMRHLEKEAVRGEVGEANTTVHVDEQGSESYEQSLNLNLAASDRELINEIDDALKRITDRSYGLCEITHEPIKKVRLDELPWARYTIHAARELDQRGGKI